MREPRVRVVVDGAEVAVAHPQVLAAIVKLAESQEQIPAGVMRLSIFFREGKGVDIGYEGQLPRG